MATKKKLLQAAAGNAGGAALNVEDVFSTYLYNGTATNVAHRIQNGIDLAGEGGLVWIKKRDSNIANTNHYLSDTERGNFYIASNSTNAQAAGDIASYNSDGWTFNASTGLGTDYLAAQSYASWTFRKAKKFFDVVTWTGDGTGTRDIPHNLGTTVGMIVMKQTQSTLYDWFVYHRGYTSNTGRLNVTGAFGSSSLILRPTPGQETTHFQVSGTYNGSGETHVAYLFAHNNNDGGFGPDGDADAIKCGSYTGNGSATGPSVDLGFEPQWLLIRNVDRADDWVLIDSMRGIPSSSDGPAVLRPESSAVEYAPGSTFSQASRVDLTATGFDVKSSNSRVNGSSQNMIYMAIRRGTKVPESGTEVFGIHNNTGQTGFNTGIVTDFGIGGQRLGADKYYVGTRLLQGNVLNTNSTAAESSNTAWSFDQMDGFFSSAGTFSGYIGWGWKRASKYFDVVAYTGTGSNRTVAHNLGVAPEMMWIKGRSAAYDWVVYHKAIGNSKILNLNGTAAAYTQANFNNTDPTSSVFTVGSIAGTNASSQTFIAYLFASLDGISKVGSYTGTGNHIDVDCGFTSGARFVLIKRVDTSSTGWGVIDTVRGLTSSADAYLFLNLTIAEGTANIVNPLSSGFKVVGTGSDYNANGSTYIFYAIA